MAEKGETKIITIITICIILISIGCSGCVEEENEKKQNNNLINNEDNTSFEEKLNSPPIAFISINKKIFLNITNSNIIVKFIGNNSFDPDGNNTIIKYYWNFGEGNISYERNPNHCYYEPGIYLITLTVFDNFNKSDTDFIQINVSFPLEIDIINYSRVIDKYEGYCGNTIVDINVSNVGDKNEIINVSKFTLESNTGDRYYNYFNNSNGSYPLNKGKFAFLSIPFDIPGGIKIKSLLYDEHIYTFFKNNG